MLRLGPARLVAPFSSSLTNRDWSNRMKQQFHQCRTHGTDEVECARPANPDETRCASASVIRRASRKHYLLEAKAEPSRWSYSRAERSLGGDMCTQQVILDSTLRSSQTLDFEEALRAKIVSQEEALQAMVDLYQVFSAGLNPPGRPVGSLLFLGPTGCGKTRVVEAAAEILFRDSQAVIKVNCGEFQHSHEISKLIGSPPGYLGHRETHPMITQEALAASHTDKLKLSFLLFDEIEKANDALWQLLLGMLDKATLTLGDNRRVDLSQTVIFMTSNLGGGEITELMQGGMGFIQPKDKPATGLDEKVERTAVAAAVMNVSKRAPSQLQVVGTAGGRSAETPSPARARGVGNNK